MLQTVIFITPSNSKAALCDESEGEASAAMR
jgi:hypothetical protein